MNKIDLQQVLTTLSFKAASKEGITVEDFMGVVKQMEASIVIITSGSLTLGAKFVDGEFVTCLNMQQVGMVIDGLKEILPTSHEQVGAVGGSC